MWFFRLTQTIFLARVFLFAVAFFLVWMDGSGYLASWRTQVSYTVVDAGHQISKVVSLPIEGLEWVVDAVVFHQKNIEKIKALEHENVLLRSENTALLVNQRVWTDVQSLLNFTYQVSFDQLILAKVLRKNRSFLQSEYWIDKGQKEGIYMGQTALGKEGIIGQVVQVSNNRAKLMPLNHKKHSIPVQNLNGSLQGVLRGQGLGEPLVFEFLLTDRARSQLKIGEMLYSSGLGNIFPAGYPVARVTQTSVAKNGKTKSFADTSLLISNGLVVMIVFSKNKKLFRDL